MKKWVIFTIVIIIAVSGCIHSFPIEGFSFNDEKGQCTSKESSNAEMTLAENKIKFSGYVITSTPCHELEASYSIEKVELVKAPNTDIITITIKEKTVGPGCVECLGEIPFNGEITINKEMWSGGGNYGISIVYKDKELARVFNYVT